MPPEPICRSSEATGKAVQTRVLGDGLSQLKRQFDQWRAGRRLGERIPLELWASAVAAAVEVDVPRLQPGDPCPECAVGKVYDSAPKVLVNVVGQPPLAATVFRLRQLRCRLCDAIFTAPLPEGASEIKYDHSCASMLAVLRFGSGMPFYRLENPLSTLDLLSVRAPNSIWRNL